MKLTLFTLAVFAAANFAFAQDAIPLEKAQDGARKLASVLGQPGNLPLATHVDLEKPQAFKAGDAVLMVIPEQSLSADALSNAGDTVLPIGQLWTHKLILSTSSSSQQRTFTFPEKDRDLQVNLYLLGATKSSTGALELVVFGADKEPIAHIPLAAADGASQSFPIEISGQKESDNTGRLTLNILGKQKVDIILKREE
jgi:hypothetical protein